MTVGADSQEFENGQEVIVFLPDYFDDSQIVVGDRIWWRCCQFDGIVTVVKKDGKRCIIG